ncbi:ribonuclease E inhibitor RraB [Limnoglobus roseus]|uniref:Regulator of ribonuclease activity B domain-containing protein n=1 Tax=Limnoglobus roseus TaxID=2598579 RepID=A0A5C1AHH9_9BACT|nr:ribonuclease E inhibitor RraB [Limnoglobus roseus]QEL17713.1 hypothetical protein PX52LOC_04712 [Limnoglobus roseus]
MSLFLDAVEDALRECQKSRMDLARPHTVIFDYTFDEKAPAGRMAARISGGGVTAFLDSDEPAGRWTVRCFVVMVPTPGAITDVELKLAAIAEKLGGLSDGWEILPA